MDAADVTHLALRARRGGEDARTAFRHAMQADAPGGQRDDGQAASA